MKTNWITEVYATEEQLRRKLAPEELSARSAERHGGKKALAYLPVEVLVKLAQAPRAAITLLLQAGELDLPVEVWVAAAERAPITALLDRAEHLPVEALCAAAEAAPMFALLEAAEKLPAAARMAAAKKEPSVALGLPQATSWFGPLEIDALWRAAEAKRAGQAAE